MKQSVFSLLTNDGLQLYRVVRMTTEIMLLTEQKKCCLTQEFTLCILLVCILCICVFSFLYILSFGSRYSQVFPLDFAIVLFFYIRKIIGTEALQSSEPNWGGFSPPSCSSKAITITIFFFYYPPLFSKGLVPYKQLHLPWNYDHQLEENKKKVALDYVFLCNRIVAFSTIVQLKTILGIQTVFGTTSCYQHSK